MPLELAGLEAGLKAEAEAVAEVALAEAMEDEKSMVGGGSAEEETPIIEQR